MISTDRLRKLRENLHYWQQCEAVEARGLAKTRAKLTEIQAEIDKLAPHLGQTDQNRTVGKETLNKSN